MAEVAHPIAEFFTRSCPFDRATLLGKGPSLDGYTPSNTDGYVIGVNEVPLVCRCDGVVFLDLPFGDVAYPPPVDLFRRIAMADSHGGRGWAFDGTYGPLDETNPHSLRVIGPTGPCAALAILARWGIRRVDLWGFDVMWQAAGKFADDIYAECVKPHLVNHGGRNNMERGTKGILWALKRWGFEWESHGWDHG